MTNERKVAEAAKRLATKGGVDATLAGADLKKVGDGLKWILAHWKLAAATVVVGFLLSLGWLGWTGTKVLIFLSICFVSTTMLYRWWWPTAKERLHKK